MVDDLIYGKLLDSLYPKSFLMTDEEGLQHEVIHYGDVKNAIEDFRIELKKRVGVSKMENEDAISRQDAIDAVNNLTYPSSLMDVKRILVDLPSAQPKRGKWKDGKCDQCSGSAPFWPLANTYYCSNFCPHCGADMRKRSGTDWND